MKKFILLIALLLGPGLIAMSQTRTITGVVYDYYGTVPGVCVIITGTSIGTVTDMDGRYSITCPLNCNVLTFSGIGYLTQNITIANCYTINVYMEFDEDEIIIITPTGIPDMIAMSSPQKETAVIRDEKKDRFSISLNIG